MLEFDPAKSISNKRKHGIDFVEAQALWNDGDLIELSSTDSSEARQIVIGKIDSRHWSAIVTFRLGNIRIISVRRSRKKEIDFYESQKNR